MLLQTGRQREEFRNATFVLILFFAYFCYYYFFNHCSSVLCLQPVLIFFLLFKPYDTIAGVNFLASVVSKGSVREARCLLVCFGESGGL